MVFEKNKLIGWYIICGAQNDCIWHEALNFR